LRVLQQKNLDYTLSTEALTFPAGNSAQTVKINVVDDVTIEDGAAETIIMSYTKGVDFEQVFTILMILYQKQGQQISFC
jgi:hypothetical protein